MTLIYLLIAIIAVCLILGLVFVFIRNKKSVVDTLFAEARKEENSGHYEEALTGYEHALAEVKKVKFQNSLKIQIDRKIKLLRSLIEDQNHSRFTRFKS